jgi:hypothetical protein
LIRYRRRPGGCLGSDKCGARDGKNNSGKYAPTKKAGVKSDPAAEDYSSGDKR